MSLLSWAGSASAQAELTGTYIRYLRVGPSGRLVDEAGMRSMQYSESGAATDNTCDVFYPGAPAVGFTLLATPAGGVAATGSNNSFTANITTTSGPTVTGRAIDWSGNWTSGTVDVDVAQRVEYAADDRVARVTVTLTNGGATALSDVYYFFSGDPDHGQCEIGTAYDTYNDVVRQPPGSSSALATASIGTPTYTFAVGSADPRARANTSGFENTDAFAAWNTPVDAGGALVDEDIGLAFREASLAAGASTTFVFYIVWGVSVAQVEARFDLAIVPAAIDGTACTMGSGCLSGFCVDGVCCDTACGGGAMDDCQACAVAAGAAADGTCGAAGTTTLCRPHAGECDVAETCDGTALTCPADVLEPATTECRASAGSCDVPETCDGATAACPADALAPTTTECRASAGDCDVPETCDGTTAACPSDVLATDGTSCADAMECNGDEICTAGACTSGTAVDCDDADVCTADACAEPGTCMNVAIAGCCTEAVDCDDLDPCTADSCASNACVNAIIPGCGDLPDGGVDGGVDDDGGASDTDGSVTGADAGTTRTDAGTPRDTSSAGCSCRAADADGDAPIGALLIALGVIALVMPRRRRR